jgi:transposase-like protein
VHKTAHGLNDVPKSGQPKAKSALQELGMAPTRAEAERAFQPFVASYEANYPKARPGEGS